MKKLIILFMVLKSFPGFAQTQTEMIQEAYTNFKKADKELNDVYQQIVDMYSADLEFIENLETSQRIWIMFRDAEVNMKYPERETGYYGSILPACKAAYLTKLTKERTNTLRVWVEGLEEKDVCSGSVMMKE